MDLWDQLCWLVLLASRPLFALPHPSVLCGRNLHVQHYTQTFKPDLFMLAMLIDIADLYPSIPLSVTLILAEGHNVRGQQDLLALFIPTLFN